MNSMTSNDEALRAENTDLRARLEEAEEMLRAVRAGELDALVVETSAGLKPFTLQGVDAEQNRFRGEMLAQVSDAVVATDLEERVTFLNAAAERQYGVSAAIVLGCRLGNLYEDRWARPGDEATARAALRERGGWLGENIHVTRGGRQLHVESSVTVLRSPDGAPTGMVAAIRNITERKLAEQAHRVIEERLRVAAEAALVGVWDWNLVTDTLVWEDAMFALYGARREDFSGAYAAWSARLHPDDRAASEAAVQGAVAGRKDFSNQFRVIWPDGSVHHLEAHGRVFRDETGQPVRMVGTDLDVTARVLRERHLVFLADLQKVFAPISSAAEVMRAVSERLAAHLGLIHCTLVEVDEASDTCTVLHDHNAPGTPNLEGNYRLSDFHPDEERRVLTSGAPLVIANVRDGGRTAERAQQFEALGVRALVDVGYVSDGRWRFVLHGSRAEPYAWPADEVELLTELAARVYVRVERARAEEALRRSEARLRQVFESNVTGMISWDLERSLILDANAEFFRMTGYAREDLNNGVLNFRTLTPPEWTDRNESGIQALTSNGFAAPYEKEYFRKDGSRVPLIIAGTRFEDSPSEGMSFLIDISERKRAEQALRENAALFSTLIAQAPMGTYVIDAQFRMRQINAEAMPSFGSVHPLIGRDFQEVVEILWGPEVGGQIAGIFRHTMATGERYISPPFTEQRQDIGVEQTYEWQTQRVTLPDGEHGVVCYFHEVTERAKGTAALRANQERMRIAAEATGVGIWDWNVVTNAMHWDASLFRMYGIEPTRDGLVNYRDWSGALLPEDLAENEAILHDTVRRCGQSTREFRIRRRSDGEVRWIQAVETVRANPDGKAEWVLGTNLDVTERVASAQALRVADRRKDEFLATLAHELRNPLAPVRNGLQILRLTKDPDLAERTQAVMERQLGQMVRLIDDLLEVSRISSGKVVLRQERMELQSAVHAAIEAARPQVDAARQVLQLEITPEPIWLQADATRICQVVNNLLTNAAKYSPDGSRIRMRVDREGNEAVVTVADEGEGIPPHMLADVFEMFTQIDRTLDRAQGGLGIGLALVRRLVDLHGGTVTAHSAGLGAGSTFTVRLPMPAAVEAAYSQVAPLDEVVAATRLRVLVVDDNVDAAESLAALLSIFGHDSRVADSGAAALAIVREFKPALVLLDIGMPGMDGYETARRIRADHPSGKLTLAALTGWGTEADRIKAIEAGFDHHFTKPVDPAKVAGLLLLVAQRQATSATGSEELQY